MLRSAFIPALLLSSVPAAAAEEPLPTIVVAHEDLDLTTSAGQVRLERRVRNAVQVLCPRGSLELSAKIEIARCRRLATAQAQAQINAAVAAAKSAPARLAGTQDDDRS